ncbi:MAG: MAPEG family protein [Undibacterium sp.]|nr:MAPEG family protein [Undibacterium sp.]
MTIAYWCVLIAVMLPYVWFSIASAKQGKLRNNDHSPRQFFDDAEGMAKRALGAHLNSFESNSAFIAGVLIAHAVHAAQARIDALAIAYIIARVCYGFLYLHGRGGLRSLVWFIGFACSIALFLIGA